ncbi:MAG: hypothetical protein IIC96_16270 [Chloroflexi bacterium]|nr:hypothetical protein [Chloroflexota bacterium]
MSRSGRRGHHRQLDKDTDPVRCLAERVILRTKDVGHAIEVAKLCDTP